MAETLLRLRDVVVRYGATTALDIPLLEVTSSEVLAIIGANGAGKSTLLRVMGLLQPIDRGTVEFPGLAAIQRNPLALRRRIATVFQQPLLSRRLCLRQRCAGSAFARRRQGGDRKSGTAVVKAFGD